MDSTNTQQNAPDHRGNDRQRWNRNRVHLRTNKGLIFAKNLFGYRGPSTVVLSKAQWVRHVRFVNAGVVDRFIEKNDDYIYNRERDGDYDPSKFHRPKRDHDNHESQENADNASSAPPAED